MLKLDHTKIKKFHIKCFLPVKQFRTWLHGRVMISSVSCDKSWKFYLHMLSSNAVNEKIQLWFSFFSSLPEFAVIYAIRVNENFHSFYMWYCKLHNHLVINNSNVLIKCVYENVFSYFWQGFLIVFNKNAMAFVSLCKSFLNKFHNLIQLRLVPLDWSLFQNLSAIFLLAKSSQICYCCSQIWSSHLIKSWWIISCCVNCWKKMDLFSVSQQLNTEIASYCLSSIVTH